MIFKHLLAKSTTIYLLHIQGVNQILLYFADFKNIFLLIYKLVTA